MKSDIDAFVYTDVQKSSLPAAFSDLKLDDGTKLNVHPVASAPLPNWTVENVEAPRRVFDTKKVRTVATVAGFDTPDATRKVTLLSNGKQVETKDVKIGANGRATVEFLTLDVPYGLTRCEVRIDGADSFPRGRSLALFRGTRRSETCVARPFRWSEPKSVVHQDGARFIQRARI